MSDGNPYRYEANWTIEQHRDELIERLGKAIRRINELESVPSPDKWDALRPRTLTEEEGAFSDIFRSRGEWIAYARMLESRLSELRGMERGGEGQMVCAYCGGEADHKHDIEGWSSCGGCCGMHGEILIADSEKDRKRIYDWVEMCAKNHARLATLSVTEGVDGSHVCNSCGQKIERGGNLPWVHSYPYDTDLLFSKGCIGKAAPQSGVDGREK